MSFKLKCKNCGNIHQYACSDLEWESVGSDERQMGMEIHYQASLEDIICDNCLNSMSVTFGFWEYPIGIVNMEDDPEVIGAELLDNKCKPPSFDKHNDENSDY